MAPRVACALVVGISALTVVGNARASETFPQAVQEHLDLACAPQCTLCHTTPAGGPGMIDKLFGGAIFGQGARAKMPETIPPALDTLKANGSDVDMDGVTDIDELRAGMNPNPGDTELCLITYGCGARIASGNASRPAVNGWGALAAALAAIALALRLRKAP
ncbi:MAG TPA: hypothetical protein VF989_05445 [Polyangiaceae bacterium]